MSEFPNVVRFAYNGKLRTVRLEKVTPRYVTGYVTNEGCYKTFSRQKMQKV